MNNTYILITKPINEIEAAVNARLNKYDLWHAPFVFGANICQAMVRKDRRIAPVDSTHDCYHLDVRSVLTYEQSAEAASRARSIAYNAEIKQAQKDCALCDGSGLVLPEPTGDLVRDLTSVECECVGAIQ